MLMLMALLSITISAQASDALTGVEISAMRSLIGEASSGKVTAISSGSTADEILQWLSAETEAITVDDRIATWLRMIGEIDNSGAYDSVEDALTNLQIRLDQDVIRPMEYYANRLDRGMIRLESLLDCLAANDPADNELERTAMVSECRFLEKQIREDMAGVAALARTKDDLVAQAEKELQAMEAEGGIIPQILGKAYEQQASARTKNLQEKETTALNVSIQSTNASFKETKKSTKVVVIDGEQFSFVLTTGSGPDDVLNDATITVTQDKKSKTLTSGELGVYVFNIKDFSFSEGEAVVQVEVKRDGYREVFYKGCPVEGGNSVTIPMAKDDGSIYLREASLKTDDMLHDASNGFYYIPYSRTEYPVSFQIVNLPKKAEGTLSLCVDETTVKVGTFTAGDDGRASLSDKDYYANKLKVTDHDTPYSMTAKIETGGKTYNIPLAFTVERAFFESPMQLDSMIPSMLPGTISVKLPSLEPVLTNPTADIGSPLLPKISARLDADGQFTLAVGMTRQKPPDDKAQLEDGATKAEKERTWKDVTNDYRKTVQEYKDQRATNGGKKVPFKPMGNGFSWDWNASVGMTMRLKWRGDGDLPSSGTVWGAASVSGSYSYTQQYLPPPPFSVPVYIGFDFKVGLTAGVEAGVASSVDRKTMTVGKFDMQPVQEATIVIDIGGGFSAGLGVKGIISAGLRGYFNFSNRFIFHPSSDPSVQGNIYYQLVIGLGLDIELKAILVNATIHVISAAFPIPKQPVPFIAEQVAGVNDAAYKKTGTASAALAGNVSLTQLPTTKDGVTVLAPVMTMRAEEKEGIKPDKEVLYDGAFDRTKLKSLTIDNGKGTAVNMVFFAGNESMDGLGYSSIQYATSENDKLVIRGALIASDEGNGTPGCLGDFDVCWDSISSTMFLLTVYVQPEKTAGSGDWFVSDSWLILRSYKLSDDGEQLVAGDTMTFHGRNEDGTDETVLFTHPTIMPAFYDPDPKYQFGGTVFAAVGEDLSDVDTKSKALGHDPGRYLYSGHYDFGISRLYRMNDTKLDDNEEVIQIAMLENMIIDPHSHRFSVALAALTGILETDTDGNQEITSNRIHEMELNMMNPVPLDIPYAPNEHMQYQFRSQIHDDMHISNIMPGFNGIGQSFAVRQMDGEKTDNGGMETTLTEYDFNFFHDPDVTDFGFTTSMNWFGIVKMAGGQYLYWLESFEPTKPENEDPASTDDLKPRYVIRCCLYDPVNKCFTAPFDLVELGYSPRTVALAAGTANTTGHAVGLYTTEAKTDETGQVVPWSFVAIEYQLKSCLDLIGFNSTTHCATAGKPIDLSLTVENTGNTLIASFDTVLTGADGEKLGVVTVDAVHPENCSVTLYDKDGDVAWQGGAEAVYRLPSDMAGTGERLVVTTRASDGTESFRDVAALGLVPGTKANFTVSVTIPASWKGTKEIDMEINNLHTPKTDNSQLFVSQNDTEDKDPGVFSEREIAAAKRQTALQLTAVRNNSANAAGTLAFDHHDLEIDLRKLRFEDGMYIEVQITNASDAETEDEIRENPPTLVFTATDPDGKKETVFRHTFAENIHAGNGYMMLIPMDLLDGDGQYTELTGTITGNGEDYREFHFFNNSETINGLNTTDIFRILDGPDDAYIREQATASFTVIATGYGLTYQWYERNGNDWELMSGETGETYTTPPAPKSWNGRQYRCVVTDYRGRQLTSRTATLYVEGIPQTGDKSYPELWLFIMVFGTVLLVAMRRRKG